MLDDFGDPLHDAILGGTIAAICVSIFALDTETVRDLIVSLLIGAASGLLVGLIAFYFLRWYYEHDERGW